MAQVLFNPLPYIDRLTRSGFTLDQARAHAEALETAFSESVVTKRDLTDVENELKQDIAASEGRLRLEMAQTKNETLRWVFAFNLGLIGSVLGIVKFFH